ARRGSGLHDGVDFSGPIGSAFRAVHGGTVTRTGGSNPWNDFKDLGNIITVKSSDGFQEIYQEFGNAGNIKVHTGDQIKTGQVLGTLGHLAGHDVHVHVGVSKGSLWNHGGYSH
ncbi:M23 family metallopeptidase, partial [Lentilactobacillus sp. G22-6]|uniref:M23 family metallopeptidase n=1 Tax=Lentilactobacillus dabitei TaxID=2831523 RepID=UPI001C25E367